MEKQIEQNLIDKLVGLKYRYRPDINDRQSLELNFRDKFNSRNYCHLTDNEFSKLLNELIDSNVFVSSQRLREKQLFYREDGTPLYFNLVNTDDWCKNDYEVVHQLKINTQNSNQRYDVIILVNGLPLVQIELKDHGINPRKAMQQIIDYKQDKGNGYLNSLLCFMQLFIVSNGNDTSYFTNNNDEFLKFDAKEQFLPIYHWADEKNNKINNLDEFADCFLAKNKLGEMISRYMVLVNTEKRLLIMRPYQIYAVKAIVNSIENNSGNGYIWHTTGSGKTLTSFKASTLLKDERGIYKCMFVVDRKDLDRQTRQEFNKFQEGCVEENANTFSLVRRMLSDEYSDKVIVSTIQKLGLALSDPDYREALEELKNERFVFIFDECHRSQFGANHDAIKEFFPKAQLFGFTGTPIFDDNAVKKQFEGEEGKFVTTKDVFTHELHNYTITHAIEDRNVLRFHVDYFKPKEDIPINGYDKKAIVRSILSKHDKATNSRKFNALFATASINDAIEYYKIFKDEQAKAKEDDLEYEPLNITCVFTPPIDAIDNDKTRRDVSQLQEDLDQERKDNATGQEEKKKAMEEIIHDYNCKYVPGYADGDDKALKNGFSINFFDIYYQDVQLRIKNQKFSNQTYPHKNKLDIVIVVDMLLTGFDSKYLNTLYVDKNLKYHSLIQAFSRTNRILNDTKPQGNILDFRGQQNEVDKAIALFSGEDTERKRTIWLVETKEEVIRKYKDSVCKLNEFMQSNDLSLNPSDVYNIKGDEAKAEFINDFKQIQKLKTQLDQYTDLTEEDETEIDSVLSKDDLVAFKVAYIDTAKELKFNQDQNKNKDKSANSVIIDELDFEFVLFASVIIDYDYIMQLISNWTKGTAKQKLTKEQIVNIIKSSSNFMNDSDDIISYIDSLSKDINEMTIDEVKEGFEKFKYEKFNKEVAQYAEKYGLETNSLFEFLGEIISRKIIDGEKLTDLFEPLDLGWRERSKKENAFMADIIPLLKRMADGKEISGLSAWEE